MDILIVTDAWHPQVNGVVRTLVNVIGEFYKRTAQEPHRTWPFRMPSVGKQLKRQLAREGASLRVGQVLESNQVFQGTVELHLNGRPRFLGALVSDDLPEIAPVVDPDGGLTFPDPTRPSAVWPPAGREADRVEPAAFWLVRTTAGLFGNDPRGQDVFDAMVRLVDSKDPSYRN